MGRVSHGPVPEISCSGTFDGIQLHNSDFPVTRAQSPNEQQTRVRAARENDRETGRSLTNGIPVDCARSGDYFDHLDEPTAAP